MKKTISLVCAMLMSVVLFAQDRELSMADCGSKQWGPVSVDGNVITSRGMGTAIDFALAIVKYFAEEETVEHVKQGLVYHC